MAHYIALEGIDGSGKTTQVKMLVDHLTAEGFKVDHIIEPTLWVGMTRLNIKGIELTPEMELMLHLLDRAMNTRMRIENSGMDFVISDRFYLSSMIYNSSKSLSAVDIKKMHSFMPQPELIFWLNRSAKSAWKLVKKRGEKLSKFEDDKQLKEYSERYAKHTKLFPQTVGIEMDNATAEEIHNNAIWPSMLFYFKDVFDGR